MISTGKRLPALLIAAFALVGVRAADTPEAVSPISLPPFIVDGDTGGRPWRYTEAYGFEILSRCSDAVTQRVVDAHHALLQLLAEILPESLQLQLSVPKALILFDEALQPTASREVISRMLRDHPQPVEVDLSPLPGGRGMRMPMPVQRYSFLPNLRLWDRDATTVFMMVRENNFTADQLRLTLDYVNFLMKNRLPALPLWFVNGLGNIYEHARVDRTDLVLAPMIWVSEDTTLAMRRESGTAPALIALEDFFSGMVPRLAGGSAVDPIQLWKSQAVLFVRWGLDGDDAPRRAGLWKFVERSAREGVTEELFTECFGLGYAAAHEQLTVYLRAAVQDTVRFSPKRSGRRPRLGLRNATEGEIARLKGDWERMEIDYVERISPSLAPKYLEQARRTLMRAYDNGERDPQLLAVIGLCEADAGNGARAREFLEAAALEGRMRPRAWLELARLRFAGLQAGGRSAPLAPAEAAEVLTPLFAARRLDPPLPDTYELIAEVWTLSEAKPQRGHLAVLDEGVRLFPLRTALILRAADLNLRHGYRDATAILVELGLRVSGDEETRQRFQQLQRDLEAGR